MHQHNDNVVNICSLATELKANALNIQFHISLNTANTQKQQHARSQQNLVECIIVIMLNIVLICDSHELWAVANAFCKAEKEEEEKDLISGEFTERQETQNILTKHWWSEFYKKWDLLRCLSATT